MFCHEREIYLFNYWFASDIRITSSRIKNILLVIRETWLKRRTSNMRKWFYWFVIIFAIWRWNSLIWSLNTDNCDNHVRSTDVFVLAIFVLLYHLFLVTFVNRCPFYRPMCPHILSTRNYKVGSSSLSLRWNKSYTSSSFSL